MSLALQINRLIRHFRTDTLFQNSVYLMLSTGVQAAFGFFFWLLNARLFSPAEIGVGSALISVSTFVAYLSLLGFNSTFVRFLPTSKRRNSALNTGLLLVFGMSIVATLVYLGVVPWLSPKLAFVARAPWLALWFVALTAASAVNLLTDSVFIAYRASSYNLLIYTIQSAAKLLLPLALFAFNAFGIFTASGLAAAIALVLSLYFMAARFRYRPQLRISPAVLAEVWHFSSSSYLANLLNIIPTLVLPLIVINTLGDADAGYFYLAFMLANLIYAAAFAVSQALFAEGSYGEVEFRHLLRRAAKLLAAVILPVAFILALFGPIALGIFGGNYSKDAGQVIMVLALAAPAVAAYGLGGAGLRIAKRFVAMVVTNLIYAATICGLALLWAPMGLVGVGWAWLVGNVAAAITAFLFLSRGRFGLKL